MSTTETTCPKCKRILFASGVVTVNGTALSTFQCDDCLVPTDIFGEMINAPLTFATDERGRIVAAGGSLPE